MICRWSFPRFHTNRKHTVCTWLYSHVWPSCILESGLLWFRTKKERHTICSKKIWFFTTWNDNVATHEVPAIIIPVLGCQCMREIAKECNRICYLTVPASTRRVLPETGDSNMWYHCAVAQSVSMSGGRVITLLQTSWMPCKKGITCPP